MKKLLFTAFAAVFVCLLLTSCGKEDDFENENFNDFIVGAWCINDDKNDVIEFYGEGFFILNDEMFGNYWVNEGNNREIKYICDDEEQVSLMKFIRYVGSYKSIVIENLPKHKGESFLTKIEEE